jgi:hypothetical protein
MSERRIVLLLAAACLACAPAPRSGEEVHIAEESALIVWDAASKTQHFIRRASFETRAKDFGFLVPTPSVPKLGEAEDAAFEFLDDLTSPPVPKPAAMVKSEAPKSEPPRAPQVVVLAREKVAGLDAAVLKANDAGALDAWLKSNGYHSSPELQDWFKPYIEKNWIITAFKIASSGPAGARLETSAVRMSFQAEQPFFPYREPAGAKSSAPRLLNVYFLGDFRPEGRVGAGGAWPGLPVWSGALAPESRERLSKFAKLPDVPARLTRFMDHSSPRPGSDDLFFSPAADQSELRQAPPAAGGNFFVMVVIAAGLVAMFILILRWRRAKS